MTKEMILEELGNQGYAASLITVTKNGVKKEAIAIQTSDSIAPIVYPDALIKQAKEDGTSLTDVVKFIVKNIKDTPQDNPFSEITDRDYVLSHIYIGLQKSGDEDLIKRPTEQLPEF